MDLADGVALIEQLGDDFDVKIDLRSVDAALIDQDGTVTRYEIKVRATPPTPASVRRDLDRLSRHRVDAMRLLYVVPRITKSLRAAAAGDQRVAVAAVDDALVMLGGREWRRATPETPSPSARGRKPWGRYALMRAMLRTDVPRSQTALATETGVSQQAVAYALAKLARLGVERAPSGWVANDANGLWDAFSREYPGPGGLRRRWSGAATLDVQVERVIDAARARGVGVLLSGDAAADRQAPFRRPVTAVLIAESDLGLTSRFVLVPDARDDATLSVVVPADPTVFATARAWAGEDDATLTDPVLTAWEVAHSRGADRLDAVAQLRRTVLEHRIER